MYWTIIVKSIILSIENYQYCNESVIEWSKARSLNILSTSGCNCVQCIYSYTGLQESTEYACSSDGRQHLLRRFSSREGKKWHALFIPLFPSSMQLHTNSWKPSLRCSLYFLSCRLNLQAIWLFEIFFSYYLKFAFTLWVFLKWYLFKWELNYYHLWNALQPLALQTCVWL